LAYKKLEKAAAAQGMSVAEYLKALEAEHRTIFRMAVAAGVYPFAIQEALKRERKKAAAK
jgi:hypothetical protein